jgi:DNA-3-methyladenine glycosylase II
VASVRWTPPAPIDLSICVARYTRWGDDVASVVDGDAFLRVSQSGDPYNVEQDADGTIVVTSDGDISQALAEVQHRFGGTLPYLAVRELADRVPVMAEQLSALPGYRPPLHTGLLEPLVTAISAQQVNLRWATTTRNRLVETYGTRHEMSGTSVWEFPAVETLAEANPAAIRALQFTTRKSEYIIEAAQAVATGRFDGIAEDSNERVIERIVAVRGLGRWTAEWFLARTLARPDAIAAGDLGVRKAISWFVANADENLPEPDIRMITADWGDGGNWGTHLLLERLATV